jgi:predicted metal-dependent enzyme (double-stranded beta helix superfamily)
MSATAVRTPLTDLVTRIRAVVARGLSDGYTQHVLHVEPGGSFSVVGLVWLPGQATPVHDHVSWCAVGVYEGQETETLYHLAGRKGHRRLVVSGHTVNRRGTVSGIAPPGDIDHVANSGTTTTISLHVYGADISRLGSSIRRCYDDAPGVQRP